MYKQPLPDFDDYSVTAAHVETFCLPDLTGKRVLHVGCGDGYLCGFAHFSGAREVIGTDPSADAICQAKQQYPDCTFLQQEWHNVPEGAFDVIVFARLLHFAEKQTPLIQQLLSSISADGLLVLESGIASGSRKSWRSGKQQEANFLFPTQSRLGAILEPYAWKVLGHSVFNKQNSIRRYVVHVQPRKPYIYLLIQPPGYGKTTMARALFASGHIKPLSGDEVFGQIARNKLQAPAALTKVVTAQYSEYEFGNKLKKAFDWADVMQRVIAEGLLEALIDFWLEHIGSVDGAIDSYVPASYHDEVKRIVQSRGYIPVLLDWHLERSSVSREQAQAQVAAFEQSQQPVSKKQAVTPFRRLIERIKSRW